MCVFSGDTLGNPKGTRSTSESVSTSTDLYESTSVNVREKKIVAGRFTSRMKCLLYCESNWIPSATCPHPAAAALAHHHLPSPTGSNVFSWGTALWARRASSLATRPTVSLPSTSPRLLITTTVRWRYDCWFIQQRRKTYSIPFFLLFLLKNKITVVVNVDNQPILLQLCDTAGQVRMMKLYFNWGPLSF